MAVLKKSKQRDAIKAFLLTRKDHPTAEIVYSHVKEEFPNISLGTVYRNLTLLCETGQAMKVPCEDGSVHFDGNVCHHYHFQCSCCGAVMDLNFDSRTVEEKFINAAKTNFDGEIEGNVSFFYGKCSKCINLNN